MMDRILMYISFLIIMLFYKSESICDKRAEVQIKVAQNMVHVMNVLHVIRIVHGVMLVVCVQNFVKEKMVQLAKVLIVQRKVTLSVHQWVNRIVVVLIIKKKVLSFSFWFIEKLQYVYIRKRNEYISVVWYIYIY